MSRKFADAIVTQQPTLTANGGFMMAAPPFRALTGD
jgi:hypothetical protein